MYTGKNLFLKVKMNYGRKSNTQTSINLFFCIVLFTIYYFVNTIFVNTILYYTILFCIFSIQYTNGDMHVVIPQIQVRIKTYKHPYSHMEYMHKYFFLHCYHYQTNGLPFCSWRFILEKVEKNNILYTLTFQIILIQSYNFGNKKIIIHNYKLLWFHQRCFKYRIKFLKYFNLMKLYFYWTIHILHLYTINHKLQTVIIVIPCIAINCYATVNHYCAINDS